MNIYRVGIFIEDEIEAKDDTEAIRIFMETISCRDCYVEEIYDEEEEDEQ